MAAVALLVLIMLTLSHWLAEPLLGFGVPLLDLSWIGWAVLAALLWIFSGGP